MRSEKPIVPGNMFISNLLITSGSLKQLWNIQALKMMCANTPGATLTKWLFTDVVKILQEYS